MQGSNLEEMSCKTMKVNPKQQANANALQSLRIGDSFRTIKDAGAALGIKVLPRKAGANFMNGPINCEIWCIAENNGKWWNSINDDCTVIEERKLITTGTNAQRKETSREYCLRYMKSCIDPQSLRYTFVKRNNQYVYCGIFKLATLDFENARSVYRRVYEKPTQQTTIIKIERKVTIYSESIELIHQ